MDSVRLIAVPFYDSLSIRRNWQDIRQLYPDITNYFPDYDPEYMPSRKFFWEIFASLLYEDAKIIINNERKRKCEKEISEKTNEIVINKGVLNLIQGSLYNINPKYYGNLSKRKRRLSETEGYQGDSLEISVFHKNRESKRIKHIDNDPQNLEMININIRARSSLDSDSFKKSKK